MNRRPGLLVLLAFLYCVSPFIYPIFVSIFFGTPIETVAKETLASNSTLRNFETFILPIVLGIFTFIARRVSYFVVVAGSIYLVVRNLFVFAAANDSIPMSGMIALNLLFVFVIIYLSRRSTRAIYFNPKMRWWETSPRYVVGWDGSLGRGAKPAGKIRIRNIAIGGAAIETSESGFLPHESVNLEFRNGAESYRVKAGVVWEQPAAGTTRLVGVQWAEDKQSEENRRIRELIRELKENETPTTQPPDRWQDFKAWISRAE